MFTDDEYEPKDDGLRLIVERQYTLAELKHFLENSCLSKRCAFVLTVDAENFRVEEICKYFLNLLKEELNLDEITSLFVAASMTYFIQPTPKNLEWRDHLFQSCFQYVDTLRPMHVIHLGAQKLWENMKTEEEGITYVFNIMCLCNMMSVASATGKAIAITLIWTIISEVTETEFKMYRFRPFGSLIEMLDEVDEEQLRNVDTVNVVYILVRCVGFLINCVVFSNNSIFTENGYREYFMYDKMHLKELKSWATKLYELLNVRVTKPDTYWDLIMVIKEYLNSNIVGVLLDKLADMRTPLEETDIDI